MTSIKNLLNKVIKELEGDSEITPPSNFIRGIPTLKKGYYRKVSPMLKERFISIGSWIDSTHGDWLDIHEMELFWNEPIKNERMSEIISNVRSSINNWEDDAGSLFAENRVTVFAASQFTFERVYLIWFDSTIEPEIWVYDSNGESRYKDLASYLKSFIKDDVSASNKKWKLADL